MTSQEDHTRGEVSAEPAGVVERPTTAALPRSSVVTPKPESVSEARNAAAWAAPKELGTVPVSPTITNEPKDVSFRRAWVAQVGGLSLAVLAPTMAILIYSTALAIPTRQALGALAVLGFAAFMCGAFMGFLFGIPRSVMMSSKDGDMGSGISVGNLDPVTTQPNTNLEQISDWLTKIVVGATLVQLGAIASGLGNLFTRMGVLIGGGEAAAVFAGAVVIYSAIVGFIQGWIAARVWFPWFVDATRAPSKRPAVRRSK
jgi:hypothetical protein